MPNDATHVLKRAIIGGLATTEKCKGCEDCINACPSQMLALIEKDGKKYAVFNGSPDDCLGCLACQEGCAEGAIKVTEL